MRLRVLIINPPNKPYSERSILIEPVDALGIASFVTSLGCDVEFVDMDVKQQKPKSIETKIKICQPELIIIPFDYHIPLHTSKSILGINKIIKIAKRNGSKVVVGGKTPKHYPDLFLKSGANVIINGEMEFPLQRLIKSNWSIKNLAQIQGISYLEEKNVKTNVPQTKKIDLDSLPIPNRSLIDIYSYIDVRTILSSRGCIGKCSFCATPNFWGRWRARNPKKVVDEIEFLVKKYGSKKILFLDDNATVDKKRMLAISQEIIRRKIKVALGCAGTISNYNKKTIKLMHKAGFRWIHYGIESGSPKVLDMCAKGITLKQIKKAIKETKEIGLRVRTSWIFDLPGTDEKGLQETINLILETKPDEVRVQYLALRVGTELYNKFRAKKELPSQYIHNNKPLLKLATCTPKIIVAKVEELTKALQEKGYLVIRDEKEWRNIDRLCKKDPRLRFISFCPSKYGLNWKL